MKQTISLLCLLFTLHLYSEEILTSVTTDSWGMLNSTSALYFDYHYATTTLFWGEITSINLQTKAKTVLVPNSLTVYPYFIAYGMSGNHLAYIPYNVPGSGSGGGGSGSGGSILLNYINLATLETRQLTTSIAWKEMVWVGGSKVVWVDYRYKVPLTMDSLNSEIFLYDLTLGTEKRITSDHSYQAYPVTDGINLAWIDYTLSYGRLFLHNISSGTTEEVDPQPFGKNKPRICGNILVWEDFRNAAVDPGNGDLYAMELSSLKIKPISTANGYQGNVFVDGHAIVWEDYRNGNADLYSYDWNSGQESAFQVNTGYQGHPTLLGDTICFVDNSSGTMQLKRALLPLSTKCEKPSYTSSFNPFSLALSRNGILTLFKPTLTEQIQGELCTIQGQLIERFRIQNNSNASLQIPLDKKLGFGCYLAKIRTDGKAYYLKAVVQ